MVSGNWRTFCVGLNMLRKNLLVMFFILSTLFWIHWCGELHIWVCFSIWSLEWDQGYMSPRFYEPINLMKCILISSFFFWRSNPVIIMPLLLPWHAQNYELIWKAFWRQSKHVWTLENMDYEYRRFLQWVQCHRFRNVSLPLVKSQIHEMCYSDYRIVLKAGTFIRNRADQLPIIYVKLTQFYVISDAIWHLRSVSTLAHVMVWCHLRYIVRSHDKAITKITTRWRWHLMHENYYTAIQ